MYMAKVMQPSVRQRLVLPIVVGIDELGHKRRRRVEVDGLAPGGGEHVVIGAAPLGTDSHPLLGPAFAVISEHLHAIPTVRTMSKALEHFVLIIMVLAARFPRRVGWTTAHLATAAEVARTNGGRGR